VPLPNLQDYQNELIEIRVFAEYLTKFNKAYMKRHFFGQDHYTSDSDIVCILHHVGVFKCTDEQPSDFEAISVLMRVMKPKNSYPAHAKNGIRSRKLGSFEGHSIKFESAEFLL
jgi:Histone deacetylation protein Rxt3